MKRFGSQVEGAPPHTLQLPAPGSRRPARPHRAASQRILKTREQALPGYQEPVPSSESCSQVHVPLWFSSRSCSVFDSIRQPALCEGSLGLPVGSLCTSGCGGRRALSSGPCPSSLLLAAQRSRWALEPAQVTHQPGLRPHGPLSGHCHPHCPLGCRALAWARTGRAGALFLKPLRTTDLSGPSEQGCERQKEEGGQSKSKTPSAPGGGTGGFCTGQGIDGKKAEIIWTLSRKET